jgi:hypothetical protein
MLKNTFVQTSEKNLLAIHVTMVARVKAFKRLFLKRGLMMKTFDYINWLHHREDYKGISDMITQLYADTPYHWEPRYKKYKELINYCLFLEYYKDRASENEGVLLANKLFESLSLDHELGCAIKKRVQLILQTSTGHSGIVNLVALRKRQQLEELYGIN